MSFQIQFPMGELAGLGTYSSYYLSDSLWGLGRVKGHPDMALGEEGKLDFQGIWAFRISGSKTSNTCKMQSGAVRLGQSPCVIPQSFQSLYFIEFHLLLQATRDGVKSLLRN